MADQQPTGEQLALEAINGVLAADVSAFRGHQAAIEAAITKLANSGEVFTSDHVREHLDQRTAEHMSPHLIGAVIKLVASRGEIYQCGWETSTRPSRHAAPVRRWRGTTAGERRAS